MRRAVPDRRAPAAQSIAPSKAAGGRSRPISVEPRVKKIQPPPDDLGSGIQVAIRCRRRNAKEIEDKSPVVVSTGEPSSPSVTIETTPSTSTFGVVALPPTRTYPFDTVFGPEADQAAVYQLTVAPMLEEVIQGYNCTLFAYGQTGTGKTYTMQGDLALSPLGNPVANSGMMPRVLVNLFQYLEKSNLDFTVKVSYVELYNEELRDLLAYQSAEPNNSAFPDTQDINVLKIFEDSSKRGVFIQGVEEVPVKDATSAIAQLRRGSQRRQVAATKFNDHSSRSHAVFSITVYMKETSNLGDDLLKVGKFNLVDLAGSENIGRSGAENKRAREAGMINQSLLTLGRVINALVEKSNHVPYRESKLTRLLQDSLGGRTKTKIIATISPAYCNAEETVSTLEYALRAKSIRNKPEVNQRMSRNALLKEYVGEIERLKTDLVAAREKNGLFLSSQTWDQISTEKEHMQLETEAAKKQCDSITAQLNATREEFEQCMSLLTSREEELTATKSILSERTNQLSQREDDLQITKAQLRDEVFVLQAYQESEAALDSVARDLRNVVQGAVGDLEGMFNKLGRVSASRNITLRAVSEQVQQAEAVLQNFNSGVNLLGSKHEEALGKACTFTKSVSSICRKHEDKQSQVMAQCDTELKTIYQRMVTDQEVSTKGLETWRDSNAEALSSLENAFGSSIPKLQSIWQAASSQFVATVQSRCETICEALRTFQAHFKETVEHQLTDLETCRILHGEMQTAKEKAVTAELYRLREHNQRLESLVRKEQIASTEAKDQLQQQFAGILSKFIHERDFRLQELVAISQSHDESNRSHLHKFSEKFDVLSQNMNTKSETLGLSISACQENGLIMGSECLGSAMSTGSAVEAGMQEALASISTAAESQSAEFRQKKRTLQAMNASAYEGVSLRKKSRLDLNSDLAGCAATQANQLELIWSETSRQYQEELDKLDCELSGLIDDNKQFTRKSKSAFTKLGNTLSVVTETCASVDQPTGSTPRKRAWKYPSDWKNAGSREEILDKARKNERPIRRKSPELEVKQEENDPPIFHNTRQQSLVPKRVAPGGVGL